MEYFMKLKSMAVTSATFLALSACANTGAGYLPIVDGPKNAAYSADLNECRSLAEQRNYTNGDVKNDALLGAGIGALVGAADEGVEGAIGGLLIGGLLGGGGRAWETQDERKEIVMNCLKLRGHRIVG